MKLQMVYKFTDGLIVGGEPIDLNNTQIFRHDSFDFFTSVVEGLRNNASFTFNTEQGTIVKHYNELDSLEFKVLR